MKESPTRYIEKGKLCFLLVNVRSKSTKIGNLCSALTPSPLSMSVCLCLYLCLKKQYHTTANRISERSYMGCVSVEDWCAENKIHAAREARYSLPAEIKEFMAAIK